MNVRLCSIVLQKCCCCSGYFTFFSGIFMTKMYKDKMKEGVGRGSIHLWFYMFIFSANGPVINSPSLNPRHKCPCRKLRDLRRLLNFHMIKNKQKVESLKLQNKNLLTDYSQKVEKAFSDQREFFSKKHIQLLKNHSEKLKVKYEENFNKSVECFQLEITGLKNQILNISRELEVAKQALISSGTRRPVYSPGKYSENV